MRATVFLGNRTVLVSNYMFHLKNIKSDTYSCESARNFRRRRSRCSRKRNLRSALSFTMFIAFVYWIFQRLGLPVKRFVALKNSS